MRIVMLGPPGAGKGTQAAHLARRFEVPHVATGDLLRTAVAAGTEVGLEAKSYMEAGRYVPDNVMLGVISERLERPDAATGFVLDGFPRTVVQAEDLDKMLADVGTPLERVVLIEVPDEVIVGRIERRRTCPACRRVYSMDIAKPHHDEVCDDDGTPLIKRNDESAEVVRTRLEVYHERTLPVVQFYEQRGRLRRVDGIGKVAEVTERIAREIE